MSLRPRGLRSIRTFRGETSSRRDARCNWTDLGQVVKVAPTAATAGENRFRALPERMAGG